MAHNGPLQMHIPAAGKMRALSLLCAHTGLQWTASRANLERRIEAEQGRTAPDIAGGGTDLASQYERMLDRLERLGLEVLEAEGDGNCQFRSLAQQLYGTQERHPELRARAVQHMRDNPADFEAFLGEELYGYIEGMAWDGTWGDELTLRALCDSLGVTINLVTSSEANWFLSYKPQTASRPGTEAFLAYLAPLHYNSLQRKPLLRRSSLSAALSSSFISKKVGSGVVGVESLASSRGELSAQSAVKRDCGGDSGIGGAALGAASEAEGLQIAAVRPVA